jgi:hypothetical protein
MKKEITIIPFDLQEIEEESSIFDTSSDSHNSL